MFYYFLTLNDSERLQFYYEWLFEYFFNEIQKDSKQVRKCLNFDAMTKHKFKCFSAIPETNVCYIIFHVFLF